MDRRRRRGGAQRGDRRTYTETNLRYSQVAPLSMYEEVNTGDNLPAQIDLYAEPVTSTNSCSRQGRRLGQQELSLSADQGGAEPESAAQFIDDRTRTLGTSACPPYHLAIVIAAPRPR